MTIRVDGLTEAKATLTALPESFREVASQTIAEGIDIIWSEAYARVPVGSGRDPHPGQLKASIGKNLRADGLQGAVGSGLVRAKFTEFGTNDTPAEPFLYPAFRIGASFIKREMKDWADEAGNHAKVRTKRGYVKDVVTTSALKARFGTK